MTYRLLSIACLAITLSGVKFVQAEELAKAGGTKFSITELAEDGSYHIDLRRSNVSIDARSRIVLDFDSTQLGKSANQDRWDHLQAVLENIKELASQRTTAISALIAAQGSGDIKIKEAQKLAQDYNGKYLEFRASIKKILGEEIFKQIDQAANKRARDGRGGFLPELADWTSKELESLTPSSTDITEKASEVLVEVAAFLEPAGQDRKPIHVENYDQIPEGILSPLPRTGLQMTSEEQAKLNQDLEYARQASQSIQEIRREKDSLVHELLGFRGQLKDRIHQSLTAAEQQALRLQKHIEAITTDSADRKTELLAAVPALSATNASLAQVFSSIQELKDELSNLEKLRSYDICSGIGTTSTIFSSTHVITVLGALDGNLKTVQSQIPSITDQIADGIKTLAADQQEAITSEINSLKTDLANQTIGAFAQLTQTLPATTEMLRTWGKIFVDAREQAQASNTLDQHSVPLIQRKINDLIPATVDLRRSGVKNGDYLTFKVRVRNTSNVLLEEKTYVFQIGSKGLYREYTGQLLFSAPTTGPNKNQFQANAGALVTWKYGYRQPKGFKNFMDWLNPGIGIHAASMHQGTATVEVGTGVAFSLWDDIITGGYGWNLGVTKDRHYVFIGIGILDLLDKMTKTTLPKQ
ncbi:MAG: hypothetical protein NTX59_02875 [Elusimicrobia bacterium]|nr:hypothetical protein [Elusimicrobiota bacterium]